MCLYGSDGSVSEQRKTMTFVIDVICIVNLIWRCAEFMVSKKKKTLFRWCYFWSVCFSWLQVLCLLCASQLTWKLCLCLPSKVSCPVKALIYPFSLSQTTSQNFWHQAFVKLMLILKHSLHMNESNLMVLLEANRFYLVKLVLSGRIWKLERLCWGRKKTINSTKAKKEYGGEHFVVV